MSLRAKLLSVVLLLAVAPSVAAGVYNYVTGARAVEALLRERARERAAGVAHRAEAALRAHEAHLGHLAASPALRAYVRDAAGTGARPAPPPDEVRAAVGSLLKGAGGQLMAVTCLARTGRPLARATASTPDGAPAEPSFQTEDFVSYAVRFDERVWSLARPEPLRSAVAQETYGSGVRTTVPVFGEEGASAPAGALVMETRLAALIEAADEDARASAAAPGGESARASERVLAAVERESGRVVYHTNAMLRERQGADVLPPPLADAMRAGAQGEATPTGAAAAAAPAYETREGERWLAALAPADGLNLTLAAAENHARAAGLVRAAGRLTVALPLLAGALAAALVLAISTREMRRIERFAAGAAAVARGDLSGQTDLHTSGEAGQLAESFRLMTERLREHVRREAESKQFESFMRLSAILTHDLKNAITGLSMLVSNMERHFDREEFRADAVASVRDATDKLRRIVARLSEPVKSLSGEYRRDSRPTDLVPLMRRVLSAHAEPHGRLYEVDAARLPASLVATVEPERVENVFENLVINALEAMGAQGGGRLTVEAGELEGGLVFFSVADTGPGMSEEFIRERLFRPFSTTKTKGIGLGLYTCREVVEAHGGRLEVESKPGAGTRFRVVLPSALFAPRGRSGQAGRATTTAAASDAPPGGRGA